ncbi:beta-glucosidase g like protein [Zymoseptoria brevis]|uniref:Probable beta-glucosidase G n=1 Tax=Zymoseptoria brevis TaxID=1047168 RepID=A0A0F4GB63_9PEZI|nr:beta-glucosidase g like protein [Zymoseptoria brevis]
MVYSPQKLLCATFLLGVYFTHGQEVPGPAWNEAHYQTSPDVFPSPNATGSGWNEAFAKASAFMSQLTLEEKATLVTGTGGPCVRNIGSVPRLGFNGMCLQVGPLAIRVADYASVFPAGLTVAASWDRKLAYQRSQDLGDEFKNKGAHVMLGPVAGPLERSAYGGRNWEGFSPNPNLTAVMFEETIHGAQDRGVQEVQRNPGNNDNGERIEAVSSNIDDRTMHELYLYPFANAIRAGAASIMCSYQRVNGSYGCQNSKTLNGLLKQELGFQGYVVSDWEERTLDMPGSLGGSPGASFFGGNITINVQNGSLSVERLDDQIRRIMTPYFHLKQDTDYPPIDGSSLALNNRNPSSFNYTFTFGPSDVDVRENHADHIRELGAAGIVLLKNVNNTLPLQKPKNIGVFGNDAGDLTDGLYSAGNRDLGNVGYDFGVLPVGGGSGTGRLTYVIPPLEAIKAQAAEQGNKALVQYVLNNTLVNFSRGLYVFLKTWATEGDDRTSLLVDWNGTALVNTVASQCSNTVVVTNIGGLNVLPFADHPNVTEILAAHYDGEQQGNSNVDVLWGDVNPSGHLPYTVAKNESDYDFAAITNSTALLNSSDPNAWQSDFKERLLIDYRWFDYFNTTVQYEFGFGLSYTTFSLANLAITTLSTSAVSSTPPAHPIAPGGNPALWQALFRVTTTVTNTGSVPGAAVPQLYLALPGPRNDDITPVRVLKGFEKVFLQPGESQEDWRIAEGSIGVEVGFSSRDVKLNGELQPLA